MTQRSNCHNEVKKGIIAERPINFKNEICQFLLKFFVDWTSLDIKLYYKLSYIFSKLKYT